MSTSRAFGPIIAVVAGLVFEPNLQTDPVGDVADDGDYHETVDGFQRTEADFGGKFAAILAKGEESFSVSHECLLRL